MTTSGHQKLISGTILGNGGALLGEHNFAEWQDAERPRFSSKTESQGFQGTAPAKRRGEEAGTTKLPEAASPQKPGGDAEGSAPAKGNWAAEAGDRYAAYWKRLKKITVVWMLAWTVPAIIMHVPIGVTSQVAILNGIPLHWFNAAFLAIVTGIALIFMYAYVMERTDRAFRED